MKNLNIKITEETEINVHFNDLNGPTIMTFSVEDENGAKQALEDWPCDANDLADIKEMAVSGPHESNEEHLHPYYFVVRNGDLGDPF
jgi:hypothetical protein